MQPQLIYIASPYTKGDCAVDLANQLEAANVIMDLGHFPYAPNLSFFYQLTKERPYSHWIEMDLAILARCDFLLRLPGESSGADTEFQRALELGIPTARSIAELQLRLKDKSDSQILPTYPE